MFALVLALLAFMFNVCPVLAFLHPPSASVTTPFESTQPLLVTTQFETTQPPFQVILTTITSWYRYAFWSLPSLQIYQIFCGNLSDIEARCLLSCQFSLDLWWPRSRPQGTMTDHKQRVWLIFFYYFARLFFQPSPQGHFISVFDGYFYYECYWKYTIVRISFENVLEKYWELSASSSV